MIFTKTYLFIATVFICTFVVVSPSGAGITEWAYGFFVGFTANFVLTLPALLYYEMNE